jgi:hypothetical protein
MSFEYYVVHKLDGLTSHKMEILVPSGTHLDKERFWIIFLPFPMGMGHQMEHLMNTILLFGNLLSPWSCFNFVSH